MRLKCPKCQHTSFSYDISSVGVGGVYWKYTCTFCYKVFYEHQIDQIKVKE